MAVSASTGGCQTGDHVSEATASLKIENNESEKSSRRGSKRHATQVVIVTTNNDTAPNRRRYGTSGGPWPTCGAPLARAGLEPGPGETRCDPVRSVVRIGARTRSPLCSWDSGTPDGEPARAARSASGRPAAVAGSGPRSAAAGCQRARPGSAPARASRGPRRCVRERLSAVSAAPPSAAAPDRVLVPVPTPSPTQLLTRRP